MKSVKKKKFKGAACILLCVLFCLQPLVFASAAEIETGTEAAEREIEIHLQIDELLDLFLETSLYDFTREEAVAAMLRNFLEQNPGMVHRMGHSLLTAFDDYGRFYSIDSMRYGSLSGNIFWGYGVIMTGKEIINGFQYGVVLQRILPDSPALRAGLEAGDEIIIIDGINVEGFGMNAVSNLFATYEDEVTLTVRRNGEDITLTMGKGTVRIPSVSVLTDRENMTAVIKIDHFMDENLPGDLAEIIEYLRDNGYKNAIIDLRGNGGGVVSWMLECLNMFVTEEEAVLYSEKYRDGSIKSLESTGGGIEFEKIAVLTNGLTASAAEIFALALRELTGAEIIGGKTFGKGVAQYVSLLSNNRDIAEITVYEILSPLGNSYHGEGIMPDIEIPNVLARAAHAELGRLNFVTITTIKEGSENNAVLTLNQRLSRIGYISPEDITRSLTARTVSAVEIFQKFNGLPVGISNIDNNFLELLNSRASAAPMRYYARDAQLECARIYISEGSLAASDFAGELAED
jgi:carboxyl-terminal processing protease